MTEDDMVGCHHLLNRNEFEQTPGDSEGQENLVCCSPWVCKELDITEQQNNKGKKEQWIRVGIYLLGSVKEIFYRYYPLHGEIQYKISLFKCS